MAQIEVYTKAQADTAIAAAIDALTTGAPGALDTLNELAAALGDDASFATTVTNALALKAPLASPALTGVPTTPTAAPGTDTTQVASAAFVQAAVAAGAGKVVQVKNFQTGAVATGSTLLPQDDTIPQSNEGDEYMTLAITPTNAAHKLRIDINVMVASSAANWITVALFQDSTASALAAIANYTTTSGGGRVITLSHYMTAGTTSATTFKVRAGRDASAAGTVTLNGSGGARLFGGVAASGITITEIIP